MLQLSDSDVAGLSGAVKEFLMSESDIVAGGGNYGEELDRASRTKNILPSLKYFFPQVPKPNEKPKALTNDQKMQNQIYMREARKLWRKAGAYMLAFFGTTCTRISNSALNHFLGAIYLLATQSPVCARIDMYVSMQYTQARS